MKTKSEILEECYYKKTPKQDPYWHTPEELRETHGYSAAIEAMESYASEQLSEQRRKMEELRDEMQISSNCYDVIDRHYVIQKQVFDMHINQLEQILKED